MSDTPVINPLASPDPATTNWVPVWNLNGSADLRYNGDYVAGSYTDGDIVVYQGVAYLCVRPTSNPPTVWPAVGMVANYGTTLPTSPYDGMEAVLVDSTTNPTYQWRFRYNAGSTSAYKWEFVGGPPVSGWDTSTVNLPGSSGYQAAGPSLAVPRAGVYIARFHADVYSATVPALDRMRFEQTAGTQVPGTDTVDLATLLANYANFGSFNQRLTLAAGSVYVAHSGASSIACNVRERWLELVPVRVS